MLIKRGSYNKKGQVTIFVIIAILVLVGVAAVILLVPQLTKPAMSAEEAQVFLAGQVAPVQEFEKDCVNQVILTFFEKIGVQAGYYDYEPLSTIEFAGPKVIAVYKDGSGTFVSKLPSTASLSTEFDRFMATEGYALLDNCTSNFKSFEKIMDVAQDKAARNISVEISDDVVTVKTFWPITLSIGEVSTTVSLPDFRLLIPLGTLLEVAADIANSEVQGVPFIGDKSAQYIKDHESKVASIAIESFNYPTYQQTIFFLKSVPTRAGEQEYPFYFAVDRA